MRTLLIALSVLVVFGCQSAPPAPKRQASQAAKDLTAKLKGMTPAERSQYLRQHPEEINAAIGGSGVPMGQR